ncbi:NUDIX domain-containing protein [bacterium]|nr:NUDIX domain-containing protein [bacterium]
MLACPSLDYFLPAEPSLSRRVRAIVLVPQGGLLFIKRVKPHNPLPYWVAPGGGLETDDANLYAALRRELYEELGAQVDILGDAFVLRHHKGGKKLEEYFVLCRLQGYDLSLRSGPEFDDPTRGDYIPDEIALTEAALNAIHIKTPELGDWLIGNLPLLQVLAAYRPPTDN